MKRRVSLQRRNCRRNTECRLSGGAAPPRTPLLLNAQTTLWIVPVVNDVAAEQQSGKLGLGRTLQRHRVSFERGAQCPCC